MDFFGFTILFLISVSSCEVLFYAWLALLSDLENSCWPKFTGSFPKTTEGFQMLTKISKDHPKTSFKLVQFQIYLKKFPCAYDYLC